MFHQPSKYLYLAVFSLLAPAWVTGQPQYTDPQLKLWKLLKASLTGPDGASYFEMGMKGAVLPTLKGKVVKLEPELRPKTVVLATRGRHHAGRHIEVRDAPSGQDGHGRRVVV